MAYIVGDLEPEEIKELERRGWKLESPPAQLVPKDGDLNVKMVWVDADMFSIMSGLDWEKA